jgi:hypothetical protein
MKKEEVKVTSKTIILGVFHTNTFDYFVKIKGAVYFDQFANWCSDMCNLYEIVENACYKANKIVFVLDDVHFPINPEKSITCRELQIVCDNEDYFNKTVFVKGDNVIDFDKNLIK